MKTLLLRPTIKILGLLVLHRIFKISISYEAKIAGHSCHAQPYRIFQERQKVKANFKLKSKEKANSKLKSRVKVKY